MRTLTPHPATISTAVIIIALLTSTASASLLPSAEPLDAHGLQWDAAPSPSGASTQDIGGNEDALVLNTWQEGTFRSTDQGQSWTSVDAQGVSTAEVVFDPSQPERGYLAGFGGIARTTDSGATWDLVKDSQRARVIDVHPDGTVAASWRADETFDSQAFILSTDGGDTWTEIPKPYEGSAPLYGIVFGQSTDEIVVSSIGSTWVTADQGENWTFQDDGARWLVSEDDGTIWRAGMTEHIHRSTDGGQSWENVSFDHGINELAPHPDGGIYVSSREGIHFTTDNGNTWTNMGAGDVAFSTTGMFPDPHDTSALFFTDEQIGVSWVGPDPSGSGYRYEGRTQGLPPVPVDEVAASPSGDVLVAGGPLGMYASMDGDTWSHTGLGIGFTSMRAVAAADGGERLYAGGATWILAPYVQVGSTSNNTVITHQLGDDDGVTVDIAVHPEDPDRAAAAVKGDLVPSKVWETTDGGETWEIVLVAGIDPPLPVHHNLGIEGVAYDGTTDRLYAALGTGIMVRDDNGIWTPRTTGIDAPQAIGTGGGTVLAAGDVDHLWRAHSDADVFLPWGETGTTTQVEVSDDGDRAWALSQSGDVHACVDQGDTLQAQCTGSPAPDGVVSIAHDEGDNALWAATSGEGLFRADVS